VRAFILSQNLGQRSAGTQEVDVENVGKALLGVAVLGSVLFGATTAFGSIASSAPAGGTVQIYAPQSSSIHGTIVITGAIGDYGKTLSINSNGKAAASGNYVKVTLHKGTFEINSATFNAKINSLQPTVNQATCSAVGTASGPVTLFDGTGLYQGITGTVNITATFGFLGPLFKSGKSKGQCNMSNNAQPISQYTLITGSGTVSFG
jgi:hypothetical protein